MRCRKRDSRQFSGTGSPTIISLPTAINAQVSNINDLSDYTAYTSIEGNPLYLDEIDNYAGGGAFNITSDSFQDSIRNSEFGALSADGLASQVVFSGVSFTGPSSITATGQPNQEVRLSAVSLEIWR